MKIGIVTYTHGYNCGQRLQNYALHKVLSDLNNEVYTIIQDFNYEEPVFNAREELREAIKKCSLSKYRAYLFRKKFADFNKKYIKWSNKHLIPGEDNSYLAHEFDIFIVGSDQIWSPLSPYVNENDFLQFAEKKQRITYAPSMSVDDVPEKKKEIYCKWLNGFDYITVREYRAAEIVKELTGKEADVVLDPAFLLKRDQWDRIRKKLVYKGKYILSLFLGEENSEAKSFADEKGIKLITISHNQIGPREFISYIAGASYVLTDSYHVVIFSLIYHIPFKVYNRSEYSEMMNSRFDTLQTAFGMNFKNDDLLNMDFGYIDSVVERKRNESIKYLKEVSCNSGRECM